MENCIFCKIIRSEIPSAKVWEDDKFLAFMALDRINPGHTLLIPKEHISYIFDMEDGLLGELAVACKPVAQALKKAFQPASGRIGVIVAGGEVSHVHIHLVPMETETDLRKIPTQSTPEELAESAAKIRQVLG